MRLVVPKDHLNTMDGLTVDIIDEDIDDTVGEVRFEKGVGRHVTLYEAYPVVPGSSIFSGCPISAA
jgi:hypothetical protein